MSVEHLSVGDRVVPAGSAGQLRSGSSSYGAAVVGCLNPFLLVSSASDMLWSTEKPDSYDSSGRAPAEVINAIQRRLPPEHQSRAPYGESLLSNELGCGLTLIQLGVEPLAADLNGHTKVWSCMGGWAREIAKEDNPSYGWVFRYVAAENLWKASHQLDADALRRVEETARLGQVSVTAPETEHVFHFQALTAEAAQGLEKLAATC